MKLTSDLIEAFVHCRYKAFLKCIGESGPPNEYDRLEKRLAEEYRQKTVERLRGRYSQSEIASDPTCLKNASNRRYRLFLDYSLADDHYSITIPAIERLATGRRNDYAVLAFSPGNKITRHTKLGVALLSTVLGRRTGLRVSSAKAIFGPTFSTVRLVLTSPHGPTQLGKEAANLLAELETLVAQSTPPKLLLTAHCNQCEYRDRCLKEATERDDLSLLKGLRPKDVEDWNQRGIFTVTQLAHTFRPKAMGRGISQPRRHSQPLQAMAIRDRTTYVHKRPEMPAATTKVFLDVEGIPDVGLFYLIGLLLVKDGGDPVRHQFWANGEGDQPLMWHAFLSVLAALDDYVLVHFGRYEKDFLREMIQRYGLNSGIPKEGLLSGLFDVHGAIRTNIFFPVYSNSLKDIASLLEFHWQGPIRSGLDSIVWRYRWEKGEDATAKEALLRYNYEDCLALAAVFNHLAALSQSTAQAAVQYTETDTMPRRRGEAFGKSHFAMPAFQTITKCAYFNYQQQKVFFRTDRNVRRSIRRKRLATLKHPKVNKIVDCQPPSRCPKCGSTRIPTFGHLLQTKTVQDLKFFAGGVKRWVVRYSTRRYECRSCEYTCFSPEYPTHLPKCGHSLESWAVYQHVALRQSTEAVTTNINDVFGYLLSVTSVHRIQSRLAQVYEETEKLLLAKLRLGSVICGDEAKLKIRRGVVGYVWVFSGPEVVIYRFQKSRDSTVLDEILNGFAGVLVSDFYSVYDSAPCPQQKCLIHLVRDINDDLLKSPFDEELKALATRFTVLMTPIIESIDRHGLRKLHLRKFIGDAERFRKWVAGQQFASKVAQGYQKRFGKYGERLFTFLSHDGVPWNNNLAESAVKLVASRRKLLDGLMSEQGMKSYLVFLSIYQTLRRKEGSFLRFLLSGKTDVFEFLGE